MKTFGKIIAFTLILIGVSNIAYAQNTTTVSDANKKEMKQQMKANMERLELTDQQVEPFKSINKKYGSMARELKEASVSKDEKRESMSQIRADRNKEMKALLTEDQYKIYQQIEAERKKQMKQKQKQKQKQKSQL